MNKIKHFLIFFILIINMITKHKEVNKNMNKTMNKLKYFLSIFILIVNINSVLAESGSIILIDQKDQTYIINGGVPASTFRGTSFEFNVANYNRLSYIQLEVESITSNHLYESSNFIITSGGNGSGVAWYDKTALKMYWIFNENGTTGGSSTITSSPVTLQYTNNIFNNVTLSDYRASSTTVGATTPVIWRREDGQRLGTTLASITYRAQTSLFATDAYIVTYPGNNLFSVSITKNSIIDSKYYINGLSTEYTHESTFNKVNITGALFSQTDGIVLNATLSSGIYSKVFVNTTSSLAEIGTTGNVIFNKSSYAINQNLNFSWNIVNRNTNFGYFTTVYDA